MTLHFFIYTSRLYYRTIRTSQTSSSRARVHRNRRRPFLRRIEGPLLRFDVREQLHGAFSEDFSQAAEDFHLDIVGWRSAAWLKVASPKVSWYFFSTHTRAACSCEMALAEGARTHARARALRYHARPWPRLPRGPDREHARAISTTILPYVCGEEGRIET